MTYNYEIGYGSYEESDYVTLTHENKFTKNQITEMVSSIIADFLNKKKHAEKLSKAKRWRPSYKECGQANTYQDFHKYVIEQLVKKYKFEKLVYEQTWSVFGWPSLFEKDDWKEDVKPTSNLYSLRKSIAKKLDTKAILDALEEYEKRERERYDQQG